jgi:hypothetical protein
MAQLASIMQPSFSAGEVSPQLWSRVDLAKYRAGLKLARNFFILPYGGAATRPGTAFVMQTLGQAAPVRMIDFVFSTLQAYSLEFGGGYMRVVMNGGMVLEPGFVVTAVPMSSVVNATVPGHDYAVGDWVSISGEASMVQINDVFIVAAIAGQVLTLTDLDGLPPLGAAGWAAYGGGGTVGRIFTMATPYAAADLALIKYTQTADTLTLTHPSYVSNDITRSQHWAWTLKPITFQAAVQTPASLTVTALNDPLTDADTAGGAAQTVANFPRLTFYYCVTALTDTPSEEGNPTGIVTCVNSALNQTSGIVNQIAWTGPASGPVPDRFNVYGSVPQPVNADPPTIFGYIGQSTGLSFTDVNIKPDYTQTPPTHTNPFANGNNPGAVNYFQGRRIFAGSGPQPQAVWMTQAGNYTNMDVSFPSRDSDAITVSLLSKQVNAIKHLVSMNALLALTSNGAWMISAGTQGNFLSPTTVVASPQSYNGCSDVTPIAINYDILYVQARGSKVRDLAYNFYVQLFTGADMSVLSSHMFYGFKILEWAYAEEPYYLVWAVRNDGTLLSFTYLKEQDVYAWARHDTGNGDGFKSVCSIPEGQENALYFVTSRTIQGRNFGQPVQYIERMASRNFYQSGVPNVALAWCVDSGRQYQGPPVTRVYGLRHLEGRTVAILADGNVQPQQVVVGGSVVVQAPASIITVGIPIQAQLQTLALDVGEPSIQGKRKKIARTSLIVMDTRGLKMGPDAQHLAEFKDRTNEAWGAAVPLVTGLTTMLLPPVWQVDGSVFIQQDQPLPATILGIIPQVVIGDDPG